MVRITLASGSIVYVTVPLDDPHYATRTRTFRITTREVNDINREIAPKTVYDVDYNNIATWKPLKTFTSFEEALAFARKGEAT